MSQWLPLLGYLGAIAVVIWKGGQWNGSISTKLDLIMTNHLPHIEAAITSLEARVAKLEK